MELIEKEVSASVTKKLTKKTTKKSASKIATGMTLGEITALKKKLEVYKSHLKTAKGCFEDLSKKHDELLIRHENTCVSGTALADQNIRLAEERAQYKLNCEASDEVNGILLRAIDRLMT